MTPNYCTHFFAGLATGQLLKHICLEEDCYIITSCILCIIFFNFDLMLAESVSHKHLKCVACGLVLYICPAGWDDDEYSYPL